ncbi:hypothetical protein ACJMK2_026815 [Sinanodonta woodiana]|uniref:Ycf15 n=1 Tax=Sinanodonta woodiana TaxID=1069815 RepID=A0ABD3XPB2_SINWO
MHLLLDGLSIFARLRSDFTLFNSCRIPPNLTVNCYGRSGAWITTFLHGETPYYIPDIIVLQIGENV